MMLESDSGLPKIRLMTYSDLALVLAWRNHPDVRRYMYTQHEIDSTEHLKWFERCLPNPQKHLLIFEVAHQSLGFVSLNEVERAAVAEWGFYVAPGAPKGSGRQLGNAALNYAFSKLKLKKIKGEALAYNQRSIQFHKALGFQEEDVLRNHHFDGERYHHVIQLGLLRDNWHSSFENQENSDDKLS